MTIREKIPLLAQLAKDLLKLTGATEKAEYLSRRSEIQEFFQSRPKVKELVHRLDPHGQVSILSLIAVGEGGVLFGRELHDKHEINLLTDLAEQLAQIEQFYDTIGGIVGYYLTFLELLIDTGKHSHKGVSYENPKVFDLTNKNDELKDILLLGLENITRLSAIFPVGGAGDRLDLHDEVSGQPLPAAKLDFCGSTLLEKMIKDIQALEYLHYKLFARQVMIPIALMTSFEKDNHNFIRKICADNKWFYRDPESIFTVVQPLAPVITKEGRFSFHSPMKLNWKPGGHGVIWKLAIDKGVIDYLLDRGIDKAFLRQVNNPIAGLDCNLLGLIGKGFEKERAFGVIATERPAKASEGMIVLKKIEEKKETKYCLTNIEYTEFIKEGLEDKPKKEGSPYSIYPANTNILFADLKVVKKIIENHPLPGMMINMKTKFQTIDEKGEAGRVYGGRLESLMQNISDDLIYSQKESGPSFAVFNDRQKVISSTKRTYVPNKVVDDTPETAFYDLQSNHRDLMVNYCGFHMPEMETFDRYLEKGPSFVIDYHPSLGPLYDVISQKVSGGVLAYGSQLQLEIAELDIDNLYLDGSLRILSDLPMGHLDEKSHLHYSEKGPKCELINCSVINKGIDRSKVKSWWRNQYKFHESLEILVHGDGEFFANGVTFSGNFRIEVPSGMRIIATEVKGRVVLDLRPISEPSWYWVYTIKNETDIFLTKKQFHLNPFSHFH